MSEMKINYGAVYGNLMEILKAQAAGGVPLTAEAIHNIHDGLIEAAKRTVGGDVKA